MTAPELTAFDLTFPAQAAAAKRAPAASQHSDRITALDGLRGLAIVLVVIFHAYARWPDIIPWATAYREAAVFRLGYLGVQLFFLISGFVIYLTIENCHSFGEFIFRRWLRLFPAMLAATILVFITAFMLPGRPHGTPHLADVLPGLLFIQPEVFNKLLHVPADALEGGFWSLFVEVKFYFIFGGLYFLARGKALPMLIGLYLASFAYHAASHFIPSLTIVALNKILYTALSLQYFGWFAIGALLYTAYRQRRRGPPLSSLLLLGPTVMETAGSHADVALACVMLFMMFAFTLFNRRVASLFSARPLLFGGFISYPLYLIHENAMIAMTIHAHSLFPAIPDMLTPIPGMALIVAAAYGIAKYVEPRMRRTIAGIRLPLRALRGADRSVPRAGNPSRPKLRQG